MATLDKDDLNAIRIIVQEENEPLMKDIKKLDNKFIRLFNFLDKDWSKLKRRVDRIENKLDITPPEF